MRPGAVVAWWDGSKLSFGVLAGEEKQRKRLVLRGGKEARIPAARVLFEVDPPGRVPSSDLTERRDAGERVDATRSRAETLAEEIDVALVWEIVIDGRPDDGGDPLTLDDLAELAIERCDGDGRAATFLALLADGLHFVRRGEHWVPRGPQAVEELLAERERVRRRERETAALFDGLRAATRGERFVEAGNDAERRYLEALMKCALREDAASDAHQSCAKEALTGAGIRYERLHEGAFRVLRRLGRFDSDDVNLQVLRFGLPARFPEEVEREALAAANAGFEREGRIDLTGLEALSIDGPTTTEIDDALSVEPRAGGGARVGVHIADPGAFFRPGDALDEEALSRGLSYYMPDVRIPMLPAAIADDAASLVAGSDRPALSFLVDVDASGEIEGYEVLRSIVRCAARLDYEQVDEMLAQADGPGLETLQALDSFARARQRLRGERGAVVILSDEAEAHVGEDGEPQLEILSAESCSRRTVTESMVLAGEVAARFCEEADLPVVYRRQAAPERALDLSDGIARDPVTVRRTRMSLRRATAGLERGPHSSLGLAAYTQVTSPIRRYQDLLVQRQITAALSGEAPPYDRERIQRVLATTEAASADARKAERAADDFWMLRYLERFAAEELSATVVQVEPRPVVVLDDVLREQPMSSLKQVEVGQRIVVRVENVNPRAGLLQLRRSG
ncbi:MAG: RNB domain-containing ribonuclease [bacterium]|nr:RNB domain-containing ribonuclease [bacterium]